MIQMSTIFFLLQSYWLLPWLLLPWLLLPWLLLPWLLLPWLLLPWLLHVQNPLSIRNAQFGHTSSSLLHLEQNIVFLGSICCLHSWHSIFSQFKTKWVLFLLSSHFFAALQSTTTNQAEPGKISP
jgi:hypothetical protein